MAEGKVTPYEQKVIDSQPTKFEQKIIDNQPKLDEKVFNFVKEVQEDLNFYKKRSKTYNSRKNSDKMVEENGNDSRVYASCNRNRNYDMDKTR